MGALTFEPAEDIEEADLSAPPNTLLQWALAAEAQQDGEAQCGATAIEQKGTEPWLIKFPARGEHPEVCALEELYARFDREAGLPGTRIRIPIHTLLRATRRMTGDEREVTKAFSRAVFNVALHNRDDHARNFAWRLGRDRCWRLAPPYDLTFSPGGQHTLTVAGEGTAPTARHLLQVAASAGLAEKTARQALDSVLHGCHALLEHTSDLTEDLSIRKTTLRGLVKTVAVDVVRLGGLTE
jgi:serine/threonine-protein kinase HipA